MLETSLPHAVLLCALAVAAPAPEAAVAAAPLVVEVDDCVCKSQLEFETSTGSYAPWTITWFPEADHQDGFCLANDCSQNDPRPCRGKFRIHVSWPEVPTAPCTGPARVSYLAEGASWYEHKGDLDLSHGFVPITNVGGALVLCASYVYGVEGWTEPDETTSHIWILCTTANAGHHSRIVTVREVCLPCMAKHSPGG